MFEKMISERKRKRPKQLNNELLYGSFLFVVILHSKHIPNSRYWSPYTNLMNITDVTNITVMKVVVNGYCIKIC